MLQVMISSTSTDLLPERAAVKSAIEHLGMHAIAMEEFNATARNALQLCYAEVQKADILVGVYAHRYGFVPDYSMTYEVRTKEGKLETRTGDGKTSITHWEYLWAMERGIPVLLFVLDRSVRWTPDWIERGDGEAALKAFLKYVGGKHVYKMFDSPDKLAALVSPALSAAKAEIEAQQNNQQSAQPLVDDWDMSAFENLPLWGQEPEPDLSTPSLSLTDARRDQLFALLPPEKGTLVGNPERISAGLSGASVFAVTLQIDKTQTRNVFAKIDHYLRIVRESSIHAAVSGSAIREFVPALVCDPVGPVEGWGVAFYQTAADTRLFARSLDGVMTSDAGTLAQKTAPLKALLNLALRRWHSGMTRITATDADDLQNWVPVLAEGMLNLGGKNRMGGALRDRARDHGIGAEGSPTLRFADCDMILPNPIAFLLNERYWYDKEGKPILIDAPRSPVHGDLHGGNLICVLDDTRNVPRDQAPYLIDFALSVSNGVPFYDLAYLEMDILLRRMPADGSRSQDWAAWLDMTEFLASDVLPKGSLPSERLENIWTLIQPIRAYAHALIQRGGDRDTIEQFERAFWLAAMCAGVMVTRRSRMEPPAKHKAALLYASRMLRKLWVDKLKLKLPDVTPYRVDWGRPVLTEDLITAYNANARRAIIDGFRKEFEKLEEWAEPLTGTQSPHAAERPPRPIDIDPDLADMIDLLGETVGNHLSPDHADSPDLDLSAAPDEAIQVADVPQTLIGLSRAVLIGEPGAGKTVTLEQLMVRYTKARQTDRRSPVPVLVPLARFDGKQAFTDYARSYLLNLRDFADALPLVWLLDALNEMPEMGTKTGDTVARPLLPEVIAFLNAELNTGAVGKFERRFVLSCRVADYKDELRAIEGVNKVILAPLSPEQIKRIMERRLRAKPTLAEALWREVKGSDSVIRAYSAFVGAEQTETFWTGEPSSISYDVCWAYFNGDSRLDDYKKRKDAGERLSWADFAAPFAEDMTARQDMLEDERGLLKLCRNPFDLFLLISLALARGVDKLPTDRAALLIEQANARLNYERKEGERRKDPTWTESTSERIRKALIRVAEAIQRTEQRTEISAADALTAVGEPDATDLLRKAERATLIQFRDTVRFQHQLWQEYFAALTLLEPMERGDDPAQYFGETWWDAGAWRESLKFLSQVSGDPGKVIRWVAPYSPELALELVTKGDATDASPTLAQAGKGSDSTDTLREILIATALSRTSEPDPHGRASAYRVLGKLDADSARGLDCSLMACPTSIG